MLHEQNYKCHIWIPYPFRSTSFWWCLCCSFLLFLCCVLCTICLSVYFFTIALSIYFWLWRLNVFLTFISEPYNNSLLIFLEGQDFHISLACRKIWFTINYTASCLKFLIKSRSFASILKLYYTRLDMNYFILAFSKIQKAQMCIKIPLVGVITLQLDIWILLYLLLYIAQGHVFLTTNDVFRHF